MFVQLADATLHAVSFGTGSRTLLAVGGWTGSWEVWEEPLAQLSADGWRCVAYDHRGAGESPVDPSRITVRHLVDDVEAVLDALGIERCILAGESQGGAIAQYAAARSPERFAGLVLSAPRPARRDAAEGRNAFADACRTDYPATVDRFVDACFPEPDCEHVKRWATNILLRAEPEQAARLVEMWRDEAVPDLDPAAVTTPTLILHGTGDAIVPIEESRQLARRLADAELVEFEGAGHVPTMTRADEVVAAIGRRFASSP